jgi:N-methylhydantoinase A
MRHRLQVHVVEIPFPEADFTDADLELLIGSFTERYEELYGQGTAFTAAGVEIVTLRCTGSATVRKPTLSRKELGPLEPSEQALAAPREIYWPEYGAVRDTPIYRAEHLLPGNTISGPAVIEPTVTTIVVRPEQTARMDQFGNIILQLDDSGRT